MVDITVDGWYDGWWLWHFFLIVQQMHKCHSKKFFLCDWNDVDIWADLPLEHQQLLQVVKKGLFQLISCWRDLFFGEELSLPNQWINLKMSPWQTAWRSAPPKNSNLMSASGRLRSVEMKQEHWKPGSRYTISKTRKCMLSYNPSRFLTS